MKKIFEEILNLDKLIGEAVDNGNEELENELYERQCELVDKVEEMGLREEFDKIVENLL